MIKKTINGVDFNGKEYTTECYFNLSKAEMLEMQVTTEGGYSEYIQKILDDVDQPKIFEAFKSLILRSYGIKSEDGKRFIKSETIRNEFESSDAYSELLMELLSDENKAAEFFNGLFPKDVTPIIKE